MRYSRIEPPKSASVRELAHRTQTRWIATAVVAVLALFWAVSTVLSAEDQLSAWGQRRSVPIAQVDLSPGQIISSTDIEFVDRPLAVLPDGIADSPVGQTVTRAIAKNETVVSARLAGGAASGPTALLENGTIGLAISMDSALPPVNIGDHVALFAPSEVVATASRGAGPASRLAEDAIVIAINEQAVTVAVNDEDAPALARALLSSTVIVALTN